MEALRLLVHGLGQLLEERLGRLVDDRMDGVDTQGINVEIAHPGEGILDEQAPHLITVWPIEIERLSPWGGVALGKVGAKSRR